MTIKPLNNPIIRLILAIVSGFWPYCTYADDNSDRYLRVEHNQLVFAGKNLVLQGVAIGDPLMERDGRTMDDYFQIAHEWNANAVRISIHPGTWAKFGQQKVIEALRANMYAALDSGLFVILDWHAIGAPNGYMQPSQLPDHPNAYDTDFQMAKDFWWAVAENFGQDGRIAFELWNEPIFPHREAQSWAKLKSFWDELTTMIRQKSGNLILVSGSAWGYDLRGIKDNLMSDSNTAYAWHVYASTDHDNPQKWAENLDGLDRQKPIVVTEWGFEPEAAQNEPYRGTAASFGKRFFYEFLVGRGLHHTAWCWHPNWKPRMLETDWQTATEYGRFVKSVLKLRDNATLVRPN